MIEKIIDLELKESNDAGELKDSDIEIVVGGRVGRVGSTTVSTCPECGAQEKTFAVISVGELKYRCQCGAVLRYDKSSGCFYKV